MDEGRGAAPGGLGHESERDQQPGGGHSSDNSPLHATVAQGTHQRRGQREPRRSWVGPEAHAGHGRDSLRQSDKSA
jgi:hypothetical protein